MLLLLVSIFVIPYLITFFVFWRNIKLTQPWKALFCATIFPVFIIALPLNIWITDEYMPWLWQIFIDAQQEDHLSKQESELAFLVSCPIALIIGFVWYLLFKGLNKQLPAPSS